VGTEGPFYELIAFTDCEGVLGSIALRKLYSDFAMFEEHAKNSPVENFYDTYKSLMAGTLVAMKDGALVYSDCPD
jgi:hypothetical protein